MFPVIRILEDLHLEKISKRIRLFVVVDDKSVLLNFLENHQVKPKIELIVYENLSLKELARFLDATSDLNLGMGTSCLKSASLMIPTILVNASYEKIKGKYKYPWLYQTVDYNRGNFIDANPSEPGIPLTEIVNQLINDHDYYLEQSNSCFDYVVNNHAIGSITDNFIQHVEATSLRVKEVLGLVFIYSCLYRLQYKTRIIYRRLFPR